MLKSDLELIFLSQVQRKPNLNRKHRSRPFEEGGPAFSRRLLTVSVYMYIQVYRASHTDRHASLQEVQIFLEIVGLHTLPNRFLILKIELDVSECR